MDTRGLYTWLFLIAGVRLVLGFLGIWKYFSLVGKILVNSFQSPVGLLSKKYDLRKAKYPQDVVFTRAEVKAYRKAASAHSPADQVPGTMPFGKSFFSELHVLTEVRPPLKLLGAINMKVEYACYEPIEMDTKYKMITTVSKIDDVEKGMQITVTVSLQSKDWKKVWEGQANYLIVKPKPKGEKKERKTPPVFESWDEKNGIYKSGIRSSTGQTLNWVKVTGDPNFPHLPVLNRLVGQRGQIVHGMWSLAQTMSALEATYGRPVVKASVGFKLPFYCGKNAMCEYFLNAKGSSEGEMRIAVTKKGSPAPHLVGQFTLKET